MMIKKIEDVKIETIYPETLEMPSYDYWVHQNQLDYNVALRNKPTWWWQFKIWTFNITATWNISVTWIWFQPKLVKFTVWDSSWNVWNVWIWSMTETSQQCMNIINSSHITSQCIYYWNPVKARAVYVSMDTDWFTINCTYFWANSYVLYECYW